MSARYGLPDHLFAPVAHGLSIALNTCEPGDCTYQGQDLSVLVAKWEEAARLHQYHTSLLNHVEAAELLAVLEFAMEYAENNNYDAEYDEEDFPEDVEFALAIEEIRLTLQDMSVPASRVA